MIIGEIKRNKSNSIRVSIEPYQGRLFLDIRLYFKAEAENYVATKKGIKIDLEEMQEFLMLIDSAKKKSTQLKKSKNKG
jgi:hypothetical protein